MRPELLTQPAPQLALPPRASSARPFYVFLEPGFSGSYPTTQDFELTDTTDRRGTTQRARAARLA